MARRSHGYRRLRLGLRGLACVRTFRTLGAARTGKGFDGLRVRGNGGLECRGRSGIRGDAKLVRAGTDRVINRFKWHLGNSDALLREVRDPRSGVVWSPTDAQIGTLVLRTLTAHPFNFLSLPLPVVILTRTQRLLFSWSDAYSGNKRRLAFPRLFPSTMGSLGLPSPSASRPCGYVHCTRRAALSSPTSAATTPRGHPFFRTRPSNRPWRNSLPT
mmetsp:Transcript_76437/g.205798  ORF Transcript_76437/g.205798 Transcript_76437/m.205798 type:complete len:216 (-) Transcript_76437:894-1541(-)